jgi:hypothetical protein
MPEDVPANMPPKQKRKLLIENRKPPISDDRLC